jgi:hypothetical protein
MRFRITDLVSLTTAVALLIAAFQTDLQFFRQLFCFGLITFVSTVAVLCFSTLRPPALFVGAIGGLAGGLIYLTIAYFLVYMIYPLEPMHVTRQAMAGDIQYLGWLTELFPVLLFSLLLGSAIGPLAALRIQKTILTAEFNKQIWLSVIPLAAAFLFALFAMFDRLTLFGNTRDWSPLIFVLLVVFVIYTASWLTRIPRHSADGEFETDED